MSEQKYRTLVYSYMRFSGEGQRNNDSIRRQTEWRDRFMGQNPDYELDKSLALVDKARSAYKDEHRTKGALGVYLEHVKQGRIPPGSILLVESVDRLTRLEPFDALEMLCFGLIKHGIVIQTQIARYDRDAMNNGQIHGLIAEIQRAYQESKHKSERIRKARDTAFRKARETGKIVTAQCPAWLEVCEGRFEAVPEAVDTIRRIFQLKLEGVGQRGIATRLNAEAPWYPPPKKKVDREAGRPGNGWRASYIKKILSNRAVIGEYQPHRKDKDGKRTPDGPPITGYYPSIVDRDVFHAVQEQLAANKGKGGRTGKKRNIFTHLVKCAYCGSTMMHTDKGKPEWRYLACDNAARGVKCEYHTVRYMEVQDVVLEGCVYLKPEQVLPTTDEQTKTIKALRREIDGGEAELADIEEQRANYLDSIGRTRSVTMRDTYEAKYLEAEEKAAALAKTIEGKRRALVNAESAETEFKRWKKGLPELMEAIADEDAVDTRIHLAAHLRDFIERIDVFPVGFEDEEEGETHYPMYEFGDVIPTTGGKRRRGVRRKRKLIKRPLPRVESIGEELECIWYEGEPDASREQWVAFERFVIGRRMSREGRFYRIVFKTGESVDVVPPGSIATGMNRTRGYDGEREKLPDLNYLWDEFQRKNGK